MHFSYNSSGRGNTRPHVVQTGTSYIKKSSYTPIVKHSTTNLNVHTNLGVSNRIYPSYSRGYGGYGVYGGYTGLYGGLGFGGLGFGGLGYGGYGNGGVAIVENDQFNSNIGNTDVNIVIRNDNNNRTNNTTIQPTTTQTLNEEFISNTTKLLQRLQDVAEARQRKGPERTLERMTQIINDSAKESAASSRKPRQHEPYVPKPTTTTEVIDIDLYTPTPCPIKRTRTDNNSRPIHRSRISIKDQLGPKPYHL